MMMMIFAVSTATDPPSPAAIQSELIPAVASLFTPNWLRTSDGDFLAGEILLKTIGFERPGGREWLPSETPFQRFYNFFGRVFGPARVQKSYKLSQERLFVATSKKCVQKILKSTWDGASSGTRFCMYCYHSKQNKKAKTKKHKLC